MANAIIKKVISYLIIASIFITGSHWLKLGLIFTGTTSFIACSLFTRLILCHKTNKPALLGLLAVTVYVPASHTEYGLDLVFKQALNIAFVMLVFYTLIILRTMIT